MVQSGAGAGFLTPEFNMFQMLLGAMYFDLPFFLLVGFLSSQPDDFSSD
jgi:hypothetical protein